MNSHDDSPLRLLRRREVEARIGLKVTALHARIGKRLFPPPVRIGTLSGWPEHEVEAVIRGHIRGLDETAIRLLVEDMVAARAQLAEAA